MQRHWGKPVIKNLVLGFLAFLTTSISYGGELTGIQQSKLNTYLKTAAPKGKVTNVQAMTSDRTLKDGIIFAVLYTHEDPDGNGGNDFEQCLAVLREGNDNAITNIRVGGKGYRSVSLNLVAPKLVKFIVSFYGENDPTCCPSIKGKTSFSYASGELKEIGTRVYASNH